MAHGNYWDKPPMNMGSNDETEDDDIVDEKWKLPEGERTAVCSKTITYVLDGEVGLLADLALMAQAAALARERNRTFFIDDTYWNRGKYGCLPTNYKALARYHFGHPFSEYYEDPYSHNLNRLRPIFDAAQESFVSTIRPNAALGALIRSARQELKEHIPLSPSTSQATYISAHLRRGDRKHRTSDASYTAVSEYLSSIENTQERLGKSLSDAPVYFASDSPSAEFEFGEAYPGRYFSLRQSRDVALRQLASSQEYDQKKFNTLSLEERSRLTKGMIVDFALLSGMWSWKGDPIPRAGVCTISSNICKIMAVGLGWDRAFGRVNAMGDLDETQNGWVELEEKGRVVPVWTAFELF
ncbi:hypothetical protein AN958_05096 [Leucoagaricus sp. SymC.cos]|nr:hypothetical protein AN958_05096 [Leucoagaricus sp. SymC.cos]